MKVANFRDIRPTRQMIIVVVLACVFVCAVSAYSVNKYSSQKSESNSAAVKSIPADQFQASNEETANASTVDETKQGQKPQETAPKAVASPKYATSSDPRSTEYSNTPPARNVQDIEIAIVRNSQVAPGTLISSNAAKSEKAYYGGDLVGPTNLTITLDPTSTAEGVVTFTVSSPDGQALTMPMKPWNDPNYKVFPANALALSASSYQLQIVAPASTQRGVYTVHLMSYRAGQAVDSWHYHKFITVTVQ